MYHCTPFRNGIPSVSYVVNYNPNTLGRLAQGLTAKRVLLNFISGHWQVCRIFEKRWLDFTNQKKREGCFMVKIIEGIDEMACGMCEVHINEAVRNAI